MSTSRNGKYQAPSSSWITTVRRRSIYMRDGWRCQWCMVSVEGDDAQFRTLDHIISLEEYADMVENDPERAVRFGSKHKSSNLITACKPCNSRRKVAWQLFALEHDGSYDRISRVIAGEFGLKIRAAKKAVGNKSKTYANCWKKANGKRLSQGLGTDN